MPTELGDAVGDVAAASCSQRGVARSGLHGRGSEVVSRTAPAVVVAVVRERRLWNGKEEMTCSCAWTRLRFWRSRCSEKVSSATVEARRGSRCCSHGGSTMREEEDMTRRGRGVGTVEESQHRG